MKKTISVVLVCVLLLCSTLTLTSCGKTLIGKYKAELNLGIAAASETYEFGLFGKVTRTTNSFGAETTVEGKYEFIENDTKITLTFPDEDPVTYNFASGEENGVEYIKLGLTKYEKVD